jgi:hypothetical protein
MVASALSEGGARYDYTIPGAGVTSIYVPPSGFDPATATDSTLQEYGLPLPPVNAGIPQLLAWETAMAAARFPASAPPFLVESPIGAAPRAKASPADTEDGYNWSGYVARGAFTLSSAEWFEPTYGNTPACPNSVGAFIWTGLGGFGDVADLGQDGTAFGNTGIGDHQAWEEALPQQKGVVALNFSAGPADLMYAETGESSGDYDGVVEDESSGDYEPWSHKGTFPSSGETGEAIVEDPSGDGLVNTRSVVFNDVFEDEKSMNDYSPNGTRSGLNGYNGIDELDDAGDVGTDGDFTDTWIRCK